jgi:hypothetical protein
MELLPFVIVIVTDGVTGSLIIIVTPFEVTSGALTQEADEVMVQFTTSPFANAEVIKADEFWPLKGEPFTFH